MITIDVPLRTARGMNNREHHIVRWQRSSREMEAVGWFLRRQVQPPTPCTFWLTRIAPSNGLDSDNLQGAMKSVRDAVAHWMGIDDRHLHIVNYEYRQQRGEDYAVRIEWQEAP